MSDNKFSLIEINAGDLGKPASKLIDAVRNAIGLVYEPTRIRKKAKAEADAMVTLALAKGETAEIAFRAQDRLAQLELRRQRNIEAITSNAIKQLPETVSDEPVNEDWIVHFFDLSQDVGDKEMQVLWSKLLAGEVANPGTYSPRTLQLVKHLRKEDAFLFTRICEYVWETDKDSYCMILTDATYDLLRQQGIHVSSRIHLQSLGLVSGAGLILDFTKVEAMEASYFGKRYVFTPPLKAKESHGLQTWTYEIPIERLTDIGCELAPISGAKSNDTYIRCLEESLRAKHEIELRLCA